MESAKTEAFWKNDGGGYGAEPPRGFVFSPFWLKTPRRASGFEGRSGPPAGAEGDLRSSRSVAKAILLLRASGGRATASSYDAPPNTVK